MCDPYVSKDKLKTILNIRSDYEYRPNNVFFSAAFKYLSQKLITDILQKCKYLCGSAHDTLITTASKEHIDVQEKYTMENEAKGRTENKIGKITKKTNRCFR